MQLIVFRQHMYYKRAPTPVMSRAEAAATAAAACAVSTFRAWHTTALREALRVEAKSCRMSGDM